MAFTSFPIPTRLLTLPTGDVVGTTDAQTLSSKTLTSPVLNGTVTGTAKATIPDAEAGTGDGLMDATLTKAAIDAQVGLHAHVSFNGTGTVAILSSKNVSSITDLSTGRYIANFTEASPTGDYTAIASVTTSDDTFSGSVRTVNPYARQTTSCRLGIRSTGTTEVDAAYISLAVFL